MRSRSMGCLCPLIMAIVFASACCNPFQARMVTAQSMKDRADVPKIVENDNRHPLKFHRGKDGHSLRIDIETNVSFRKDSFRLRSEALRKNRPVIQCVINGEKAAPLLLDTGFMAELWVDDRHVAKYGLPIFINTDWKGYDDEGKNIECGFTYIPKLKFGEVEAKNPFCTYLGVHLSSFDEDSRAIKMGIIFMRRFHYILLDQNRNEIEFSHNGDFQPAKDERWRQYPFTYERDCICVKIPMAGKEEKIMLDTGSVGLLLPDSRWNVIAGRLSQPVKMKKLRGFFSGFGRTMRGKYGVIPTFQIGDNRIDKLWVEVYPDQAPLFANPDMDKKNPGIMGMQCFKGTVMVLDFKHKLLWVKGK